MADQIWHTTAGDGPLVAVAVHDGHAVRDEIAQLLALNDEERLREEDPHTGEWAKIVPTHAVARRSRFEVDLNRPRDQAVYRRPEDAWGLKVWKHPPSKELVERSLALYDDFYSAMEQLLRRIEQRFGRFVVLDLHNYNHRREGPHAPPADVATNPQVNIGTGTMDRSRWAPLVNRFMDDLRAFEFPGGCLDVRENIKFHGGYFSRWVHEIFPESGCSLAVEFKKFFMDEWTGEADLSLLQAIERALRSTRPGLQRGLQ